MTYTRDNTTTSPLLDVLTREGVLITVSCRYWRAAKKLQAQDLGLDPDDVTDRLISLGHKKLLPREALGEFALIESRAHALVDANTFPFLNGLGHFLPNRRLSRVTDKLSQLESEFQAAREAFISRYAWLRDEAIGEWRQAARRLSSDPESIISGIQSAYPTPDRLERYFLFGVNLFQIRVPERLATELVSLSDQREIIQAREQATEEARKRISAGVESFVQECVASLREQTADYRDNARARQRLAQGIKNLADSAREMARADSHEIVERFGQMGVRRFNLADKAA